MQKLRKRTGLAATDMVDVYIGTEAPSTSSSSSSSTNGMNGSGTAEGSSTPAESGAEAAASSGIARVLESQVGMSPAALLSFIGHG